MAPLHARAPSAAGLGSANALAQTPVKLFSLKPALPRSAAARPQQLRVSAIAEAEKTSTAKSSPASGASVASDVSNKLRYQFGKAEGNVSARDAYQGAAWSVRERLLDAFDKTHAHWK